MLRFSAQKLEAYQHLDNKYLLSLDGTGFFSSKAAHCDQCCQKNHKNGSTTYYHQILQGAIVHPSLKQVIPLAPEPISYQDGRTKNDCELNAAKRFLEDFRREHPKLPTRLFDYFKSEKTETFEVKDNAGYIPKAFEIEVLEVSSF